MIGRSRTGHYAEEGHGRIEYHLHARDLRLVMDKQREELRFDFACLSIDSRRALLTV
jgi:hypothetical protein